jgi:hypothetical protein
MDSGVGCIGADLTQAGEACVSQRVKNEAFGEDVLLYRFLPTWTVGRQIRLDLSVGFQRYGLALRGRATGDELTLQTLVSAVRDDHRPRPKCN